jgi:anti-sigma regulatory factor (Ser/Thr protein kinase)
MSSGVHPVFNRAPRFLTLRAATFRIQRLAECIVSPASGQPERVSDVKSRLELSLAADPISVRITRDAVMRWFREQRLPDGGLGADISLATSEAVANVVRHAYGESQGRVDLDAEIRDGEDILIVVSDRGRGLAAPSESPRNGLGLPVMGRVANGVTVASDANGTTVSLRFQLPRRTPRSFRRRRSLFARPAGLH